MAFDDPLTPRDQERLRGFADQSRMEEKARMKRLRSHHLANELRKIAKRVRRAPRTRQSSLLMTRVARNLENQASVLAGPGNLRAPTASGLRQVRMSLGQAGDDAQDAGLEDVAAEIAARQFDVEEILEEL